MAMQKINNKKIRRTDESIQDEILRSLWNQKALRSNDVNEISVSVENGHVCLSGHVSKNDNYQYIEKFTRSIPGVVAVHNHLVTDHDLSNQVILALGNDERTCPFKLPVFSYFGWVGLGGRVPNRDIQCASEETAASVASVRGVILVPNIKGENPYPVWCMVQPRIGDIVYRDDLNEGTVYQVVINPQNRLVTHAIVRVNQSVNGWQISCDYLLPVKDIRLVNKCGIFLKNTTPPIHQNPGFNAHDYPIAPLTWQPPYPYAVGSVRWPRLEKMTADQRNIENGRKAAILDKINDSNTRNKEN